MVEDSQLQAKRLSDLLIGQNLLVDHAATGEKALELFAKTEYDLILLDMILPDMNGIQFFNKIKERSMSVNTPVVIISGASDKDNIVDALLSGVNDYITKPYHDQEVVTRVKQQLKTRQNAKELIKINEERARFFAILAHDIRNPFNALLGFSNLLIEDSINFDDDEKRKYIGFINESAKSLHTLLENVLSWSAFQSGNMIPKPERFDVLSIIDNIFPLYEHPANSKKIRLVNKAVSHEIETDKNMLSTILRNLLSNAIKFTPSNGQVSLTTRLQEDFLEIIISDSGIGITTEQINNLFTLDPKRIKAGTDGEQGTGLGLALCYDFIHALGGSIKVESEVGAGAEFKVALPVS